MSDSGYPNFLTVDAQGRVTADFSGHVHASGLDLLAGQSSTPPDDRRVRWLNQNGVALAEIYSTNSNPSSFSTSIIQRDPAHTRSAILGLNINTAAPDHSAVTATALDGSGASISAKIIGSDGSSDFVRTAGGTRNVSGNAGFRDLTWTNGQVSAGATIAHGITTGAIPNVVVAMGGAGSGALMYAQLGGVGINTFDVQGVCTNSAALSGTFRCYWWAFG